MPHSVLVIDDDHDIRDAVQSVLEDEGYVTTTAANGKEGLERLKAMPRPDLILLDLMMPVMTGLQFLEVLRAEKRLAGIPVVVISAYKNMAHAAGASAFLHKPIDLNGLVRAVSRYCGGTPHESSLH